LCILLLWQDVAWLGIVNDLRRANKLSPLSLDNFELAIDRFEKESFAASLDPQPDGKAGGGVGNTGASLPCAVCEETDAYSMNRLLVCDGCSLTVHQVSSLIQGETKHVSDFVPNKLKVNEQFVQQKRHEYGRFLNK